MAISAITALSLQLLPFAAKESAMRIATPTTIAAIREASEARRVRSGCPRNVVTKRPEP